MLKKHVGHAVNYTGIEHTIDADTVAGYLPLATNGNGLVLCEDGDEVIDASSTVKALNQYYEVHLIPGGSHRFESLDDQITLIQRHKFNAR